MNKNGFMRVAILLPRMSSIACGDWKAPQSGLIRAFDERWIRGGAAQWGFCGKPAPTMQFSIKLFDNKLDHPDSFMKRMANFFFNCAQCFLFTNKLGL